MLPDKETKCHRTGFEKTCFECVTLHGCRLWKHIQLEFDPGTGKQSVDKYDCMDSLLDLYQRDMLRRQVQTTASVDSFRKEAQSANDHHMVSMIGRINRDVRDAARLSHVDAPQNLLAAPSDASDAS